RAKKHPSPNLGEAGQIFLLMKKDYRISRNVRLAWFISHLHQPVCAIPEGLHDDELEVVSIIPHGWQPDEPVPPGPYLLVPSTWVTFLARQYRFVIELDLSPSTGIVDDSTEEIIFDEIFHSLSRCLLGLLRPFRIPGSNILFRPEIFVTIQAYSSIIGLQSHQVLVQGCQLEEQKLQDFLQQVHVQLGAFENKVAEMLQRHYRSLMKDDIPQYVDQHSGGAGGVSLVSPDVGLVSMIRQGILALQLLPANSSAGIIVITDGVTSVPDVAVCETLLNQLRSSTIACSFVQVGGVYSYDCSFGYIPNVELMKFIAMATLGSYLSSCPELEPAILDINVYHKAFLLYSFLRSSEALNPEYYCVSQHKLFNEHLVSASSNPALTMRRRKHADKEIHADLISVVSVRLREGYSIRELRISKGVLEMKLVLLWKHNMRVEYLAIAPWPLDPSKRSTRVEVVMEGSYDILHDISCTLKKPITSMYRTGVIRRFWNTLQSITQTDQMLVHLKSFDTVPEHFKIPESTKNGVPLFYIPPGSTTPVLSLQHSGGSESFRSQFASYWKPILSMDANFWQRWLHVHRIVLLLEHDIPVPKHLHTPGNNGRYSTVLCRISHTTLTSLLRDWSSFVLVEGYSYVKLMLSDANQPPASFCVVRIIWKAPCMVLRLGFPLGTSAHSRNKILEELRDCILQLRFPHRVQSKETTPRVKRKMFGISSPSKSPPPLLPSPALSDRPCLVLLHKPLEKLLIKYDKLPLDFRTPFVLNLESPTQNPSVPAPLTTNRSASSTLASLSRYFYHQRWIWSVQSALGTSLSTAAMAQILSTLTEIRLSEGFHFASSGDGIINMVLEVPVQSEPPSEGSIEKHSCIIQYILFPPNVSSTKDSFSTDEDNDTEVEAIEQDAELHLVSECWVEPQSGHVMSSGGSWRHLHGLTYPEIPQALFPRDQSCIGVMLTFENIVQLCQNKDRTSPILRKPPLSSGPCVHEVPFHFDLMKLLPKCQQIEMFLLTLSKESEETAAEASIPNDLLMSLFHGCLVNDINDREIPLYGQDHVAFMEQVLHRDREGHASPFSSPGSPGSTKMMEDGGASDAEGPPQWRCYAKMVNPQHLLLTFIPATFSGTRHHEGLCVCLRHGGIHYIYADVDSLCHRRSQSLDRASAGPSIHPRQKELVNYCNVLQEHYHQCYVKGMFKALQQGLWVSNQDLLTAVDYCEEQLQEIDITNFLMTLCGHLRTFRESHPAKRCTRTASFRIGSLEQEDDVSARDGAALQSESRYEEAGRMCARGQRGSPAFCVFDPCELPSLCWQISRLLLQDKFLAIGSLHFKTVPTNPHYFFYCPSPPKREDPLQEEDRKLSEDLEVSDAELAIEEGTSAGGITTESDPDLEVEYREHSDHAVSLSESDTVNQDDDSFSVLGGESLNGHDLSELEMPPLFVHLICSVSHKSQHGSMAVLTLPTCLGKCTPRPLQVSSHAPRPLHVSSSHAPRLYTSESSASFPRSPAQPSSYRSDEEIPPALERFPSTIRWLLEDELVSALRHSNVITRSVLQKVLTHVCDSEGRPHCHRELVQLQFVFGPEHSLQKFKEVRVLSTRSVSNTRYCSSLYSCVYSRRDLGEETHIVSLVTSCNNLTLTPAGYDGGSSDSECGDALISEQDSCRPLMPDFWLIVNIHQDRVEVCTHTSVGSSQDGTDEVRASESLHQLVVRKVGEICRVVNQRLLLQDLHDTHLCNSLLVAESEEDIWKSESPYATYRQLPCVCSADYSGEESYQPRDYLAATMHFMPGHFACDVVWRTVIHIHPRLKMGPNMGVSRAIQSLRSVLNAFSVVNRKNMFVYQERSTKAVFYLRLSETSGNGRSLEMDLSQSMMSRSLALSRSQEPISFEDVMVDRLSLDLASSRSMDSSRPVGQMDKHILLHVHGVGEAGEEITDDLVKVLRKRLDEATLDIITVMLQRNCKLTPADVEFIQPRGTPPTEVLLFTVPQSSLSCLQAMAYYLRQNLLIFLHTPKYTDSNGEHHFQHFYHSDLPELDLFLYNKPGGQGTGGKGIACIALSFVDQHGSLVTRAYLDQPLAGCSSVSPDLLDAGAFDSLTEVKRFFVESCPSDSAPLTLVRFDVWEKGNISSSQLSERLSNSMRHALCDVIIEYNILQSPMCVEPLTPAAPEATADARHDTFLVPGRSPSHTPPSKTGRRSFWDMLSKPDIGELGPPKTTDDIVSDRPEELRTRRRHKTDSLKTLNYSDKSGIGIEQRKRQMQLEEGDAGSLHPLYSHTCLQWMNFMNQLGCPSVQLSSSSTVSRFLVPSILLELFTIITSLACDTSVRVFEKICGAGKAAFVPYSPSQQSGARPAAARELILLGRNFHQWRYNSEQGKPAAKTCTGSGELHGSFRESLTLYTYNWSPDLGASLSRSLVRLVQWQNARSHVVHCLLSQKLGLFHHCCFLLFCLQDPNPFLNSSLEVDAVIRSPTPPPHKEQIRLGASGRSLQTLHFPPDLLPFDEVLRDVMPVKPMHLSPEQDTVSRHGAQFLEIKSTERKEVEKQVKIENLFVTWQQRSAQSNMPISAADLDTLKQSARLVHYCATPLLFDPTFQSPPTQPPIQLQHRPCDGNPSLPDRSYSCDSAEMPSWKVKDEPWLQELCTAFMQQYIQYLQSTGFILVQLRPASPARSRASKPKNEGSPKSGISTVTTYHLQRALPGGIVLMELSFQGCYFCVKQHALECSRIPMGQSVNSQLSMLFTEECDKVRDLMHVHSFSYDFHLRVLHQYLLGSHMTLRQGYDLASFLQLFISQHPDIPKYGRNHVYQGMLSISTGMIAAHQLYNYIADHASAYHMKPLRMSRPAAGSNGKKSAGGEQNEYGLVSIWNSAGMYKDSEGLRHHDDFDVSLLVCHNAVPFEEQPEQDRHVLRLRYYVIMTSQRELFPRLTADMRRFKKPSRLQRDTDQLAGTHDPGKGPRIEMESREDAGAEEGRMGVGNLYNPLLDNEVKSANRQLEDMVKLAKSHCRRDNLWKRLYLMEPLASDKLKLGKLSSSELQELLDAVHGRSVAEIDPQLEFLLSMSVQWYQSLIKVLLSRFPQSCRHFFSPDSSTQYLVVLNQKFTDCFVLVFLDSHSGKTSLKVVFREPFPEQPQNSESPLPQLVSTYHHLESVINTACFNLWSGLL
uniref:SZT2 subunit of KICSTOR complex n=1 Tax=Leptobrachium leishanense TaxID=445787 RepID=A0A8C5Q215_9ANUR